jgi:transposase, IS5 family
VPHPTTLMKITTRCGEQAVAGLNEALLAKAVEAKLLRTDKVRADTTVVPAAVGYPTDSGLLAKAIGTMARTVERVRAAGGATVVTTVLAHQATSTGAGKLLGAHPRER